MRCAALLLLAGTAFADSGVGLILRPDPPDRRDELELEVSRYLDGSTDAGNDFDFTRFDGRGRVLLGDSWRAGFDAEHLELDTSDARLPGGLTDVSFGAGLELGEWMAWTWKATLGFGTASDEPFSDSRGWYGIGNVAATKKLSRTASLSVVLNYNGNRGFLPDWPLPGVQYSRFVSPRFRFTVGIPFNALYWKPAERWEVELSGIPVFVGGAVALTVSYEATPKLKAYFRYGGSSSYFHVDGTAHDRRLRYEEQTVELGVEWEADDRITLRFAGGYGFEREFEIETHSGNEFGKIGLDDEPFLTITLAWAF